VFNLLIFKGIEKITLLDFPGLVSTVVFVGGCNMRCPYCHNPDLINNINVLPDIKEKEVIEFLKSKKNWIDAVTITGGEPTIHPELKRFIKRVKKLGFKVKLDTNGLNPKLLRELLSERLLDYIAMDIKASPQKYPKACGVKASISKINQSIKLIRNSGVDYEFRTTVVPGIHTKTDLVRIGKWLKGSKKYVLQQFRSEFPTLDPKYMHKPTYSLEELKNFKQALESYFDEVEIRGG